MAYAVLVEIKKETCKIRPVTREQSEFVMQKIPTISISEIVSVSEN